MDFSWENFVLYSEICEIKINVLHPYQMYDTFLLIKVHVKNQEILPLVKILVY